MRKSIFFSICFVLTILVSSFFMKYNSITLLPTSDFVLANAPDNFYSPPPPIIYKRFDSGTRPFAVAGSGFRTRKMQILLKKMQKIKRYDTGMHPMKLNISF